MNKAQIQHFSRKLNESVYFLQYLPELLRNQACRYEQQVNIDKMDVTGALESLADLMDLKVQEIHAQAETLEGLLSDI